MRVAEQRITTFKYAGMCCISIWRAFALVTTLWFSSIDAIQYWKRLGPPPREMVLGSPCKSSLQCLLFIPQSHCDWHERICTCQPYHIQHNDTHCLPASLLGFSCSIDEQCTLKVPNSKCEHGVCRCKSNFVSYRRDKCLPPAKMGDYCLKDEQCYLGGKYTYCKYIIPRVYGKCRCPLGNALTSDDQCLPNLGKNCESDEDCEAVTSNSFCKPVNRRASRSKMASPSVCACRDGFEISKDKLHCEPIKKSPAPISFGDDLTAVSDGDIAPVSLGKRCVTSLECQVRDPFSTCKNGRCECIINTPQCNSLRTGCHNDTFQCRSGQCISWYFVCDKNKNCEDGSDEENCKKYNCPKEAFQCDDGTCLSRASVCNGRWECPDGSDEARCYRGIPCDPKSFRCRSGQCLPQYAFCNAVTDCLDGSDEDQEICEQAKSCPKGTFQCGNNKCRSTAILCSGLDGCGDNSDEDQCEVCYCQKPPDDSGGRRAL